MKSKAIWTDIPPPPDKSLEPELGNGELIQIKYSESNLSRAVVSRIPNGRFKVELEQWTVLDSPTPGKKWMSLWGIRDSSNLDSEADAINIAGTWINYYKDTEQLMAHQPA